jgi:thymidylate synthase
MQTLRVRNVHEALPEGLRLLREFGENRLSRAGAVLAAPFPVMTIYSRPCERVLFWPDREANPFFHLMEALWMLAGRNDVQWLAQFNKRMVEYSDDGETLHGAYGYRWRQHFVDPRQAGGVTLDQIDLVLELLDNHPSTRRAVIQMWDCTVDLMTDEVGKDICCNDLIFLKNREYYLDMTVLCRSNDVIWGAYGANAVHFSILQEYIASRLGWKVGKLYQYSDDYHAYLAVYEKIQHLANQARDVYSSDLNPYNDKDVKVYTLPLVEDVGAFERELKLVVSKDAPLSPQAEILQNRFLYHADVMRVAYLKHKAGATEEAIELLAGYCPVGWDFGEAGIQWLDRRLQK